MPRNSLNIFKTPRVCNVFRYTSLISLSSKKCLEPSSFLSWQTSTLLSPFQMSVVWFLSFSPLWRLICLFLFWLCPSSHFGHRTTQRPIKDKRRKRKGLTWNMLEDEQIFSPYNNSLLNQNNEISFFDDLISYFHPTNLTTKFFCPNIIFDGNYVM